MACLVAWEGTVGTSDDLLSCSSAASAYSRRKDVDSIPCRVVYDRVDCAVNCRYYGQPKRIALTLTVWVGSPICRLSLQRGRTSHVKDILVPLPTGPHLLVFRFVTNLKPNLCKGLTG